MKHPEAACNAYQKEFLARCQPADRAYHALMFKVGNIMAHFHLEAEPRPGLEEYMAKHLTPLEITEYKRLMGEG